MTKPGYNILYHQDVVERDIPLLDTPIRLRIKKAVEQKISLHPEIYGLPLRSTLKKLWKLRVGEWRIVYEIKENNVIILAIAHRKDVYKITEERKE